MTVENLNEHRAVKEGDCRLWTVKDCLQAMLRDIESGEVSPDQVIIHYFEPAADGDGRHHNHYAAGVDFTDHVALLNIALRSVMDKWMK